MFKVKTEKQLNNLLKLISEEAVRHTKNSLKEDKYDDYYQEKRSKEKSMFEQDAAGPPAAPKPPAAPARYSFSPI